MRRVCSIVACYALVRAACILQARARVLSAQLPKYSFQTDM